MADLHLHPRNGQVVEAVRRRPLHECNHGAAGRTMVLVEEVYAAEAVVGDEKDTGVVHSTSFLGSFA